MGGGLIKIENRIGAVSTPIFLSYFLIGENGGLPIGDKNMINIKDIIIIYFSVIRCNNPFDTLK